MTDAPERIWAVPMGVNAKAIDWSEGMWTEGREDCECETEYVRADLIPQWQPIETAPKDGTPMLFAQLMGGSFGWNIACGNWQRLANCWWGIGGRGIVVSNPTHWMPLPEPPK